MNIKKHLRWCAGLLALLLLTGCQQQPTAVEQPDAADDAHLTVYASFYPIYALSQMLLGDVPDMEVRQLVQPQDGCLRDYQLSDWDLYQLILQADALIIGGRGLESFESAAQNLGEDGPAVVTLFQNLELDNNGAKSADENASHLADENPHLYLSAMALPSVLESLHAYMLELDPAYASVYAQNLQDALAAADELIAAFDAASQQIDQTTPVALMNEALIYPAKDLNLNVVCRIDRESGTHMYGAELEAALQQLKQADVQIVFVEKQAPDALVNALADEGYPVVRLDILSTGHEKLATDGYFAAMRKNLQLIQDSMSMK